MTDHTVPFTEREIDDIKCQLGVLEHFNDKAKSPTVTQTTFGIRKIIDRATKRELERRERC